MGSLSSCFSDEKNNNHKPIWSEYYKYANNLFDSEWVSKLAEVSMPEIVAQITDGSANTIEWTWNNNYGDTHEWIEKVSWFISLDNFDDINPGGRWSYVMENNMEFGTWSMWLNPISSGDDGKSHEGTFIRLSEDDNYKINQALQQVSLK